MPKNRSLCFGFHSIMNLFGVLKYKKMGEDFLRDSGIPFTIIRSGTQSPENPNVPNVRIN